MGRFVVSDPDINRDADLADAEFFKRLAHPSRIAIIRHLLQHGEKSVSEIESDLGITQPSLSQQLTDLRSGGLIAPRRQGKQVFYSIADNRLVLLLAAFDNSAAGYHAPPAAGHPIKRDLFCAAAVFATVEPAKAAEMH